MSSPRRNNRPCPEYNEEKCGQYPSTCTWANNQCGYIYNDMGPGSPQFTEFVNELLMMPDPELFDLLGELLKMEDYVMYRQIADVVGISDMEMENYGYEIGDLEIVNNIDHVNDDEIGECGVCYNTLPLPGKCTVCNNKICRNCMQHLGNKCPYCRGRLQRRNLV